MREKMTTGKTLAFHSYKGGTGKTTLIANLAAFYAMNGMKVCLLDFDLYAPSLTTYFRKSASAYLNNLLNGEAEISDVLVDLSAELGLDGKLFLGFSSPGKEDVRDIEIKHEMKWQLAALRRFLSAKNQLFEEYKIDYLFLDMDIEGTKKMVSDIYDSLAKYGSKYFIILNKVPGASPIEEGCWDCDEKAWAAELEDYIGTKVVGSVPCFCDIQFSRHEFLFAVKHPDHPFSKRVITLAEKIKGLAPI